MQHSKIPGIIHDNAADWPARQPKGVTARSTDTLTRLSSSPQDVQCLLTVHDGSGFPAPRSFGVWQRQKDYV